MKRGCPMENSFKNVQEAFDKLKEKFQAGEISSQQFIDEMKPLRIKDDQGRYWMIGAQTGKWYYFNDKEWVQAEPPSPKEEKAYCFHCGFENKLDAVVCGRCGGTMMGSEPTCEKCGAKLPKPYVACPECGASAIGGKVSAAAGSTADLEGGSAQSEPADMKTTAKGPVSRVLRSVRPFSFLLFGGVLGALGGLLLGAFEGATGYFDARLGFLPAGLLNFQGSLPRAGIFAVMGAAAGFVIVGLIGFLKALIVNLILSIIGGVEYQTGPSRGPRSSKVGEEEAEGGTPFGLMR